MPLGFSGRLLTVAACRALVANEWGVVRQILAWILKMDLGTLLIILSLTILEEDPRLTGLDNPYGILEYPLHA